jgi:hypothetical protein
MVPEPQETKGKLSDLLLGSIGKGVSAAISGLITTFLLLGIVSIACAIGAYRIAGGGWDGTALALLALAAGFVGMVFGAVKRSIGLGVRAAIEHSGIAGRIVGAITDRLGPPAGKKLTLPEAQQAVEGAVREEERRTVRGWFAGKIRTVVLHLAEAVILVMLRQSVRNEDGGIDVELVRQKATEGVDNIVLDRVNGFLRMAMMITFAIIFAGLIPAIAFRLSQ